MPPRSFDDRRLSDALIVYEAAMRQMGFWDYADLLVESLQLLKLPEIRWRFREKTRFILVDEFQDINAVQYAIVKEMACRPDDNAGDCPKITAIGDPKQAIYGFRGADPAFIDMFLKDFGVQKTITLDISYRCPQTILDAAACVIGGSVPVLRSAKGDGPKLVLKTFKDDISEAKWIAKTIEAMTGAVSLDSINMSIGAGQMRSLSDVAVLFRVNALSDAVARALKERGIPYKFKAMSDAPEIGRADVKTIAEIWEEAEGVSLLSMHASKGLEFPIVFIIGCEEGVLPWRNGDVAEEERLFYVGITRSSERLFLCISGERALYARGDRLIPSRFLSRISGGLFAEQEQGKDRPKKARRPRQKDLF
ncbi:ATP-dependent helicase [Dissulfurimicrobium hydrothermale]|nr:ATP-dependent helicase [Dissulfurimicrobium hydrothermale]